MESSHYYIKSLKDTLLEYATLNIDLLIPKQNLDKSAVPLFPKDLFEEILEKSKDMCWSISNEHLMSCVKVRDKLKWSETSCFIDNFMDDNLELFAKSLHKVKVIKTSMLLEKPTDKKYFNELSKAANTLEDLDLSIVTGQEYENNFLTPAGTYPKEIIVWMETLGPLKLKQLRLNLNRFELFPFTLNIVKLTVLELHNCRLTESFLVKLVRFKHLIKLSFDGSSLGDCSMENVINAVVPLKCLRFLNLCMEKQFVDELMLNKILKEIVKLEILELKVLQLKKIYQQITPKKKLKVLNYTCVKDTREDIDLTNLAERIGHCKNLEGLMTIISTTPTLNLYHKAVCELFWLTKKRGMNLNELIEAEKKGIFNFRSPLRLAKIFHARRRSKAVHDVILKMTCYACPEGREWMKNFIECNENTHLANKFKSLL